MAPSTWGSTRAFSPARYELFEVRMQGTENNEGGGPAASIRDTSTTNRWISWFRAPHPLWTLIRDSGGVGPRATAADESTASLHLVAQTLIEGPLIGRLVGRAAGRTLRTRRTRRSAFIPFRQA